MKAYRWFWITGVFSLTILISVTGATQSGVPGFSNLGIQEFTRTLIKDAPLSATVVMEHTQTSGDGKVTTRSSFGNVFRDSEGRTRHDELSETKGSDGQVGEDLLKTTINDPVAGLSFLIDPKTNTARRKTFVAQTESGSDAVGNVRTGSAPVKQKSLNSQVLPVPSMMEMGQGLKNPITTSSGNAKRESLGRRQVEGFAADGTRIVMTVPAGTMNNEKEIRIACERWYSPSLKTLILVECSDSRYGKTTYRMTQIKTNEPPTSLFKVPADYKIYE